MTRLTTGLTPEARHHGFAALLFLLALLLALPAAAEATTRWRKYLYAGRVNDVVGPRRDGHLVISAGGKLWLVGHPRDRVRLAPRKRSRPRYLMLDPGIEPYIAHISASQCGFRRDEVYALSGPEPALLRVTENGATYPYVSLPANFASKGIVLDTGGLFGGQLLVIGRIPGLTQLYGVCNQQLTLLAQFPQRVEGGLAIAPPTFGDFVGQLLGAEEQTGNVYAIAPGAVAPTTIATPAAPAGGDIGVESLGIVPQGMTRRGAAFLSDRLTPGNFQPGSGNLTHIRWRALKRAGVREGDLLVATEAGALTFAIRCAGATCTSQLVAHGVSKAHSEGHIAFAKRRLKPLEHRPPPRRRRGR